MISRRFINDLLRWPAALAWVSVAVWNAFGQQSHPPTIPQALQYDGLPIVAIIWEPASQPLPLQQLEARLPCRVGISSATVAGSHPKVICNREIFRYCRRWCAPARRTCAQVHHRARLFRRAYRRLRDQVAAFDRRDHRRFEAAPGHAIYESGRDGSDSVAQSSVAAERFLSCHNLRRDTL